jgi:hypothetical protein
MYKRMIKASRTYSVFKIYNSKNDNDFYKLDPNNLFLPSLYSYKKYEINQNILQKHLTVHGCPQSQKLASLFM